MRKHHAESATHSRIHQTPAAPPRNGKVGRLAVGVLEVPLVVVVTPAAAVPEPAPAAATAARLGGLFQIAGVVDQSARAEDGHHAHREIRNRLHRQRRQVGHRADGIGQAEALERGGAPDALQRLRDLGQKRNRRRRETPRRRSSGRPRPGSRDRGFQRRRPEGSRGERGGARGAGTRGSGRARAGRARRAAPQTRGRRGPRGGREADGAHRHLSAEYFQDGEAFENLSTTPRASLLETPKCATRASAVKRSVRRCDRRAAACAQSHNARGGDAAPGSRERGETSFLSRLAHLRNLRMGWQSWGAEQNAFEEPATSGKLDTKPAGATGAKRI